MLLRKQPHPTWRQQQSNETVRRGVNEKRPVLVTSRFRFTLHSTGLCRQASSQADPTSRPVRDQGQTTEQKQ